MAKKKRSGSKTKRRTAQVNKLVDSVLAPEIRGLESQRNQVQRDYMTGVNEASNLYERGKGDLDYIYGETQDFMGGLKNKSAAEAAAGRDRSAVAAQALRSRLGDTYSGVQNDSAAELARLGISGGGNMSGLLADAANAHYTADQSSENARSTLDATTGNADLVMNLLQGMNTGSKLSASGKNLNKRNDAHSALNANRISNLNKLGDAITETRASRSDLFTQLFSQLQQSGWKGFLR